MTGTLTYAEPYKLTGDAFAVVALVKGTARATESSIVASQIDRDITAVPYAFSLDCRSACDHRSVGDVHHPGDDRRRRESRG